VTEAIEERGNSGQDSGEETEIGSATGDGGGRGSGGALVE
jgi:hypothetical protein